MKSIRPKKRPIWDFEGSISDDEGMDEEFKQKEYVDISFSGLNPQPTDSKSTKVELRPLMKANIIPKPYFSLIITGSSGSGKSSLLSFMMNNKDMYKGYFDEVIAFGRTLKSDDIWSHIKTNKVYTNKLQKHLDEWIEKLEKESGSDGKKKNRLFVFEDISAERKMMNSPSFKKMFTQNRHYRCSCMALGHKYKTVSRLCRLQAHGIIMFPANMSEVLQLAEDWCPRGRDKKEFSKLIEYAHTPSEKLQRPFIYINTVTGTEKNRFRRGFEEVINCC